MSAQPTPPRIVPFSVAMKPAAAMQAGAVPVSEMGRGTKGGLMIMRALTMSPEEKAALVAEQSGDPLVVWFAMLSPAERIAFVQAAERTLKADLAEELNLAEDAAKKQGG